MERDDVLKGSKDYDDDDDGDDVVCDSLRWYRRWRETTC